MWLFYLYSTVKIRLLYLVFPWRNLWLRHFVGYSFGTLKKKHQPVSMTQPFLILKEWAVKCLSHKAHKRNNWRKNGMFSPYCGDETTTPSDRSFRFYPWLYTIGNGSCLIFGCAIKNGRCFFLEAPKEPIKCLSHKAINGTSEEKTVYSHHTVEMKQPRPLTGPSAFILGCTIGNGSCLIFGCAIKNGRCFSLKLQRNQ